MPESDVPPGEAPGHVGLEVRDGGIAWLSLGGGRTASTALGTKGLEALEARVAELEELIGSGGVSAVVVSGARPGMFVAGTDVDELRKIADREEAIVRALAGQRALRRLEELSVPTIAAIDGPCLEAGLELALSCSYRLASDSPTTRLGLSQVRLGLVPALGGTVRLPRLIGIQASLELILTGDPVAADEAVRLGLVDEVLPVDGFAEAVDAFARKRVERGRVLTGARRRVARRLLEDTAPGRRLVITRAARRLLPRLEQSSPAARRALRAVAEGVGVPLEIAFQNEAAVAGELMACEETRALLHASALLREARRAPGRPAEPGVERVGVLGAGVLGSEISFLLASADFPVLIKDLRRDALLRGGRHVLDLLEREQRTSGASEDDSTRRARLVSSASGFGGFGTLDLVVAAVGRRLEATEEALREAEEHTRPDCVLASASLAVSPTRVQQALERPERVVGLRFSRPVDLFPLLEIVPGEATSEETVETCLALAHRLGRVPLVVSDRIDTPGSRLLGIHFAEALRLLAEGATVGEIDRAAESFGFTLGPFRRMDAMGVGRCVRLLNLLTGACGERMLPDPVTERLTGSPPLFHRYRNGLPRRPNPGLPPGIRAPGGEHSEAIRERLLLSLINEAALTLPREPSLGPEGMDVVALAALGFPRALGGPLYHADRIGPDRVALQMREFAGRFGERFEPAPLLQELVEDGRDFHGGPTGHRAPAVLR